MVNLLNKLIRQLPPYLFEKYLKGISLFGTSFFYLVILSILVRITPQLSTRAFISFFFIEIISGLIKISYLKHRPIQSKRETLLDKYEAGSFPSIHAARITAMSIFIWQLIPHDLFSILLLSTIIFSVSYSRVHHKRHYWTDIIGGIILGAITMTIGLNI
mgnify:FL=1